MIHFTCKLHHATSMPYPFIEAPSSYFCQKTLEKPALVILLRLLSCPSSRVYCGHADLLPVGLFVLNFYFYFILLYNTVLVSPYIDMNPPCFLNKIISTSPSGSAVKNSPAKQFRRRIWSLNREDPLEWGMATYSSSLAWRIPWTEETEGLQSMGLQRVRHDWSNWACNPASVPYSLCSFYLEFFSLLRVLV